MNNSNHEKLCHFALNHFVILNGKYHLLFTTTFIAQMLIITNSLFIVLITD